MGPLVASPDHAGRLALAGAPSCTLARGAPRAALAAVVAGFCLAACSAGAVDAEPASGWLGGATGRLGCARGP
eukprot:13835137-Alexandrium_andersonii.AAC.1